MPAKLLQLLILINSMVVILADQAMLNCGACRLIISELEKAINLSDPKKKISVGSFRVDPKGNQDLNEIPYARSEVHIHELLDDVCSKTLMYGITEHPLTNKQLIVNMQLVGETKNRAIVDASQNIKAGLKNACNDVLENHEDIIVKFIRSESRKYKDPAEVFCLRETNYCGRDDFIPFPPAPIPSTEASAEPPAPTMDKKQEL